ncbi:hypothetical protein PBY51_017886 [Eleginops maclovinus]|uniref:C2H2-type domain-containing protein n=1 Tax=Eleginops maclovinus TaxID=56733 RepID=A0AAN7XML6_ELEMC|nr:hypothetical protein PBY51_017886 [Eleginops maclovinus]
MMLGLHGSTSNPKMYRCVACSATFPGLASLLVHQATHASVLPKVSTQPQVNISPPETLFAMGTELTGHIKVEVTSPDSEQSAVSQLAWVHPGKSFLPFSSKSSMKEQHMGGVALNQREENSSWDAANEMEDHDEGEWTMPLDDEMEVLNSTDKTDGDGDLNNAVTGEHEVTSLRYFVRDGIKRYPCNRCQKTYSRQSTLRRHLQLCGFRPRGPGTVAQSGSHGASSLTANNMKPMFACFVCGREFNRKDNMMVHSKKCQLQQKIAEGGQVGRGTVQQSMSGNATEEEDESNWGIMSLPSVLPRRVTCECGVGFTSPRLLLVHLQKHAQESYTCPTCGETVNSWADYEVHLQIHMHPHHQLLNALKPQRSQPLLLRFQQMPPQQKPPPQSVHQPPQKQPRPLQLPNPTKKQQRIVCTRCSNTFSSRCSLRRHLSWNRCKGGRATNPANPPKTFQCSKCNSDFPNTTSLMFHQRSGACKPAIKPVRCPVCLRWFGTVDGLQRHLLTHKPSESKQSESYRCDVCQGTYSNLKSLKNHRRRIHRIMAGDTTPKTQLLTS